MYHIAYKVLRTHRKFIFQESISTPPLAENDTANSGAESVAVGGEGEDSNAANDRASISRFNSAALFAENVDKEEEGKVSRGSPTGREAAMGQRGAGSLAKANVENVRNTAKSVQLVAELEEKKCEMKMCSSSSCQSEQNEENEAEYFRMVRRMCSRRVRDREATKKIVDRSRAASDCDAGNDRRTVDDRNESA